MKLVVNIQLLPNKDQVTSLKDTLAACNTACNWLSQEGFKAGILRQFDLHKLTYRQVREKFNLSAQAAVRCIAKVADAYKLDKKTLRHFRSDSAQPYDDRIIRFIKNDIVSIWVLGGRIKIPFVMGEYQRKLFTHRQGEVDLMHIRGKFYLACVCDIDEPALIDTTDILGVDLGVVNIATDSNGKNYSGKKINSNRAKHAHRRRNLQRKGTRAATRKLKKIAGKQARFQKDTNHCISKAIVADAKRTDSTIALEDLGGIRDRVTAKKQQRARLANWGFAQLRLYIMYKSKRVGIPAVFVDPRNTSRTCPECGHIDKANRKTRDEFVCIRCGFAGPADAVAALNIRARALVNAPMVAEMCAVKHASSSYKPMALV
jgi:putative transposase